MLLVKGEQDAVQRLTVQHKLSIEPMGKVDGSVVDRLLTRELGFAEVVIPPRSKLKDRTVAETGFAERFDLQVVSITRQNEIMDHLALPISGMRYSQMEICINPDGPDNAFTCLLKRAQWSLGTPPPTKRKYGFTPMLGKS
jgi:hypothetical protein